MPKKENNSDDNVNYKSEFSKEDVMWEHAPMEKLAGDGELYAYKHEGFWQCMDTARDLKYLEDVLQTGKAPWKTW